MNEKKYSAEPAHEPDAKLVETIVKGVQTDIGRKALVSALDVLIEAEERQPAHPDPTDPGDIPDFLRRSPQ